MILYPRDILTVSLVIFIDLPINASVAKIDVSPAQLDAILEKYDQYRSDLTAALVRWNRLENLQQQQDKLISSYDGKTDIKVR